MTGIYQIKNKINNKIYIGKSIDIEKRWGEHIRNAKYPDRATYEYPIYTAIRKYGIENFLFEVLEQTIEDDNFMYERENYYYEKLQPEYNQMRPERNAADFLRRPVLQIDKKTLKVINSFSGVTVASRELNISRSAISNVLTGRAKSSYGYYWCFEDEYQNFVEPKPQYEPNMKKVAKIDNNTKEVICIYDSVKDAATDNNLDRRIIGNVANGRNKTGGGYIWAYV